MDFTPDILYKDMHLCLVNKPFGMLSQKDKSNELGINELLFNYLNKPNFWVMLQRLDRVAGGLMTLATSKRAGTAITQMQLDEEIAKTYYVICERAPLEKEGRLEQYIKKLNKANRSKIYEEEVKGSKSAVLEYKWIATVNDRSLIEVKPKTGRTHQIRAQMANMGCPVVGDKKYGKTIWLADKSICLFSQKIEFIHPITKARVTVQAPLPIEREIWADFKEEILKIS